MHRATGEDALRVAGRGTCRRHPGLSGPVRSGTVVTCRYYGVSGPRPQSLGRHVPLVDHTDGSGEHPGTDFSDTDRTDEGSQGAPEEDTRHYFRPRATERDREEREDRSSPDRLGGPDDDVYGVIACST